MSIKLRLENATDVLDLDGIATTGSGYQALRGTNLFGLPPVTVQWSEGAGDGAMYRGRRVRTKEGDLPLDIVGTDRAHLKELVSDLAKMLSAPCLLVAVEPDESEWATVVTRTSGGGFLYGIDTTGELDLQVILTLTGDPYFTSLTTSTVSGTGTVAFNNTGDAEAYPIWTISGSGVFEAVSPRGEVLRFEGTEGGTVTLDARKGTARDGSGANRYAEMAPSPRFWSIPAGASTATVSGGSVSCSWKARKWMVV